MYHDDNKLHTFLESGSLTYHANVLITTHQRDNGRKDTFQDSMFQIKIKVYDRTGTGIYSLVDDIPVQEPI